MQDLRMAAEKDHTVDLDLEAFENEIGKEIDALFIPAGMGDDFMEASPGAPAEQVELEMPPKPEPAEQPVAAESFETKAPLEEVFSLDLPPVVPPPQKQSPEPEPVAQLEFDTLPPLSPEPAPERATEADRAEATRKLVESFEIAYLSLDWDFSPSNVKNLAGTLDRLEEHCLGTHETDSLYKILRAVLNHLASRPDGIPVEVNEVMRDAQKLLKSMLVADGNITDEDKQELRSVISRVQAIKQRSRKKEERPAELTSEMAPVPAELPGAELRSSFEIKEIENADYYRLERLIGWVDASRTQLNAIHSQLHEENLRLKRIEEICQTKPALAPLANRIATIHASVQEQVNSLWEREVEWQKSGDWLREMVARYASAQAQEGSDEPADETPEPVVSLSQPPVERQDSQPQPEALQEEPVCCFTASGRTFAVPAASVVKVQPINSKKYGKVMAKGFATLGDFKPFFKSVRHGVTPAWEGLPTGILKSYQFIPVPAGVLKISGPSTEVGALILLSNGRQHALIAADSDDVEFLSAMIPSTGKDEAILSAANEALGRSMELVNVEWILNDLYGTEGSGH